MRWDQCASPTPVAVGPASLLIELADKITKACNRFADPPEVTCGTYTPGQQDFDGELLRQPPHSHAVLEQTSDGVRIVLPPLRCHAGIAEMIKMTLIWIGSAMVLFAITLGWWGVPATWPPIWICGGGLIASGLWSLAWVLRWGWRQIVLETEGKTLHASYEPVGPFPKRIKTWISVQSFPVLLPQVRDRIIAATLYAVDQCSSRRVVVKGRTDAETMWICRVLEEAIGLRDSEERSAKTDKPESSTGIMIRLRLAFQLAMLVLAVACAYEAFGPHTHLIVKKTNGVHLTGVPWLPKGASDVCYYRSPLITAYEFNISERDFRHWAKKWGKVKPITKPITVTRYSDFVTAPPNAPPNLANTMSSSQFHHYMKKIQAWTSRSDVTINHGLVYRKVKGNGLGITVAYDASARRAYFLDWSP